MWPRVVEAALGMWLVVASMLLAIPGAADTTVVPLVAGIVMLGLAAIATKSRHAHLFVLLVALGLIVWGWARFPRPGPPAAQNAILVGLTLALFGIIPNDAYDPPVAWRPHTRSEE
jgi:hypothetical protein